MGLRTFKLLTGAGLLATALAAHADSASAPTSVETTSASGLQEIVVTARRTEESLQDVPISISVLSQADLNKRNITSTQDLGNYVPSLTVDNQFSGDAESFAIRGFYQELSSTPTVGVYFADAPEPRGGTIAGTTSGDGVGAGQLFDLENLQVLKGPQGTLFGRNTTGGTILLLPAKPTSEFGGYVDAGGGNYGMNREQGVLNLPLSDTVRLRLGFDREQRNGWQDNISGIGPDRMDSVDYYAARVSLVVDVTPNLENYTVFNYSVSDPTPGIDIISACAPYAAELPGYAPIIALSGACQAQLARQSSHSFDTVQNSLSATYQYTRQWQVVNTDTWAASDAMTLKNIASYSVFVNRYRGTIFGDNLILNPANPVFQPGGGLAAAGSSIAPGSQFIVADTANAPGTDNADQRTVSEEIQAHGQVLDSRLTWQAGLYAELSDPLQPSVGGPIQSAACTTTSPPLCGDPYGATLTAAYGLYVPQGEYSTNTIGINYHDYGVYSQESYKLLDNLTLTGGFRYTWDLMSGYSRLINFYFPQGFGAGPPSIGPVCFLPGTTVASDCNSTSHSSSNAPTGLVDLEYKPVDQEMVYAKYSRGYRQGGIQPRSAIPSYQPESIDAFELGSKTSYNFGDVAGTLDVAAFYNKLSDQQLQVSYLVGGAYNQSLVNIGASQIYGLEVDSSTSFYHAFRLDVNAAYLHTEITQIGNANEVEALLPAALRPYYSFASGPILHAPLPDAPAWRVAVTGSYILPVPASVGNVTIGLGLVYTGEEYMTAPDDYTPPGGRENYLPGQKLVNANLEWHSIAGAPVDVSVFCTNLFNLNYITHYLGGYDSVGLESGRQGEPRMFGASVKYRFGGMSKQ
jgi:iron complex outermembrane receptor protein